MNKLFSVGIKDFARGLVVAVFSGVLVYVYGIVQSGTLAIDWRQVALVAVSSCLGYIVKNYLSDESGKLGGVI